MSTSPGKVVPGRVNAFFLRSSTGDEMDTSPTLTGFHYMCGHRTAGGEGGWHVLDYNIVGGRAPSLGNPIYSGVHIYCVYIHVPQYVFENNTHSTRQGELTRDA